MIKVQGTNDIFFAKNNQFPFKNENNYSHTVLYKPLYTKNKEY